MRGRRAAWTSVVVALVVLLGAALVACTDEDDPGGNHADRSPTTEVAGDPTQVPRAFVSGADDGWALVGATDTHLVGLGGPAADEDRFGQTFDLATGAVTDIPLPPFETGREVVLERAAFGAELVTVAAFAYEGGIDPDEVDITTGEPPSTLITYRLDPVAREWTRIPLPAPYTETPRLALRSLDVVGSDGAVALLDGGITEEAVLAALDGDAWAIAAEDGFTDPLASTYCATDTTFWQLESDVVRVAATTIALDDATIGRPTLPARATDDRWELATIDCTADAVVLGVSGGREQPTALYVSTDGVTWIEREDPFGPGDGFLGARPANATQDGLAGVVAFVGGMDGPARTHVVTSDAEVIAVDAADGFLAWRGRTASYLLTPSLAPGAVVPDEPTFALRTVELP